jgi:hypothetical protein
VLGVGVDWAEAFHDVALGQPGKDDAEDAWICCLLALDTYLELRKLVPHGQIGAELRAIARDDERAARDERRIGNRLRAERSSRPRSTSPRRGDHNLFWWP